MADMGYDVSDYTDIDPIFGSLADFDAMLARAHGLGLKVIVDQVLSHSSDRAPVLQGEPVEPRQPARPTGTSGPTRSTTARRRTTGSRSSAARAWAWDARRHQYYLHNFLAEQPDFNFHNPEVQDWLLSTMRFWLERGVDGFRLDTVNFYFHDELLRDDPADFRRKDRPEANPYAMQYHLFSKNQPENLVFLERMRKLLDEYEARALVGEMGESHHAIRMMGEYTTGKRLHKAYSFEMLGDRFDAGHFRGQIEEFYAGAPGGWPTWAFSNHDVPRHVTRWKKHGHRPRAAGQARRRAAAVARGLGLPLPGRRARPDRHRARAPRADRPAGHPLLARADRPRRLPHADGLGRDPGQRRLLARQRRTMAAGQGGAGRERRRLPARPARTRCWSSTARCCACAATPRSSAPAAPGSSTSRSRSSPSPAASAVLCIFNLSPETHRVRLTGAGAMALAEGAEHRADGTLTLHPNGFAIMEASADVAVSDVPAPATSPVP